MNTHVRDQFRELWHEVAYVEFTSPVSFGTADVVSAGAITYPGFAIMIEFFAPGWTSSSTAAQTDIRLFDGATNLGRIAFVAGGAGAAAGLFLYGRRRLTPSAASHTYKINAQGTAGSTIQAGAGGAGVLLPGFIRIMQKGA